MRILLLILGVFFLFFAVTSYLVALVMAFAPLCAMVVFTIIGVLLCIEAHARPSTPPPPTKPE